MQCTEHLEAEVKVMVLAVVVVVNGTVVVAEVVVVVVVAEVEVVAEVVAVVAAQMICFMKDMVLIDVCRRNYNNLPITFYKPA